MLVFLIMQQKWRNVILVDADPEESGILLNSLNEKSVSVASVSANMVDKYVWPEKFSLSPPFNGYVMVVDLSRTEEAFRQLLGLLKEKYLFGPHIGWIIGVNGCLNLSNILHLFDEGDKVVIVASDNIEPLMCRIQSLQTEFKIWSLHSIGNKSILFEQKILDKLNDSIYVKEPLFQKPFTDFGGRILKITSLGSPPIQIPPKEGKWKWRGYIFRIVNTLADIYNFSYTVKEADNRLYGMLQEDGTWSGMIGELVNKSMDMGVGDLSWTLDRGIAADLTSPVFPETVTFIYRAPGFYSLGKSDLHNDPGV
ncbi:lig_chan-Glu_bd domain-containing protein [Nephila pilipes]|uniref:Lig_chan-Glu_bd domain-containing protein n=1 Tax=Nephila pilipes TaxID=299642 RepID=A0A8X6NX33_NEPPI|nr:lig_chan-Glu_bd domain-containing protein [Nephila pilipes]